MTTKTSIVDFILDEDYERYNELLNKAAQLKANAPKAPRGPMTKEQKIKAAQARLAKAQAKLNEMLAAEGIVD